MPNEKLLVLVDGSSYLYRAFHALPPLTNSRGEPTGAVYGVVSMLKRLLADYDPALIGVVFDAPGKTFRDELYPEYKANRPPMPDEMRAQIEPLYSVVRALGMKTPIIPNVEADDVIGTLARQAVDRGMSVVISTGDKDMAQLVNKEVRLINTMSKTTLGREGVIEKFGVPPERIVDFLALVGDSVDNVPGVPKCGPKTAAKWLEAYGSLEGVMTHADDIKGKIGENLRASLAFLPQSKELVTIKCDLSLELAPDDLQLSPPDTDALRALFERLEFRTWRGELDQSEQNADDDSPGEAPAAAKDYQTLLTKVAFEDWLRRLKAAPLFAFDTETTSLQYMDAEIVGVSFAAEARVAAYLPFAHRYPGAPKQLSRDYVLKRLAPLLEDSACKKVGQNLKYDKSVLANHGVTLRGIAHDTMLESYVLDSTATRHDMDSLAAKYLGEDTIHFEDIAGKGAKQLTFDQISLEEAGPYAAEDADITLRLHQALWPKLQASEPQRQLYEEIELPLVSVLSRMERTGVRVDADMLFAQSAELERSMVEIEQRAFDEAGKVFNLGSPKQIQEILYEQKKLPVRRKTPKGQPSTAEDVLQELALDYPLPKLILDYRSLSKLKSTYTDKLPDMVNSRTGRVHTSYHQAVASTGRLSSSEPNLQNIPVRTEEGRRIRQAFVAPAGAKIVAADYSQIELRIMAHLSGDEGLLGAFAQGLDIHSATAAEVFGGTPEAVNSDQRRAAKAINFGLIYGMSAFGLARQLGIGRGEAQAYVDLYFSRYPGVKAYMDETRKRAAKQGFVETLFGRRLYLPEIKARNPQRRAAAERTAINAPMQGTAADIIKRAMIAVDAWLSDTGVDARMIMQVHDELVFEAGETVLVDTRAKVAELMTGAARLSVPLLVDVGVGTNWDEAH